VTERAARSDGPAIGPSAYEVGEDVRNAFVASDPSAASAFTPRGDSKFLADLYSLARQRLAKAGIMAVFGGTYCTYHERDRFFSYRRDGATGRMASLIWLAGT
jgi:polyphenol oxidase